jgi:hypothetical protein
MLILRPRLSADTLGLCLVGIVVLAFFLIPIYLFDLVLSSEFDGIRFYYPLRVLTGGYFRNGEFPWWNHWILGGMPLFGSMQHGVLYPLTWLFAILEPAFATNLGVLLTYLWAACGTYRYTRLLHADVPAAVLAAWVFTLGGFMIAHLQHWALVQSASWLPWVLVILERGKKRCGARLCAALAICLALQVFAGAPQISFFTLLMGTAYVVFFLLVGSFGESRWRLLAFWATAVTLGVLMASTQLLAGLELAQVSWRHAMSFENLTAFSLPPTQILQFLFPYLFGSSWPTLISPFYYWGDWNFHELIGYVGLLPIMLALSWIPWAFRDRLAIFWFSTALLSLGLALGRNTALYGLIWQLPGFHLFRVPARYLVIFDLAVAVLAALALTRLRALSSRLRFRDLLITSGGVFGAMLLVALLLHWGREGIIERVAMELYPRGIAPEMLSLSNPAVYLPLVLCGISTTILLVWARRPNRWLGWSIVAMALLDLSLFGQFHDWRVASPTRDEIERRVLFLGTLPRSPSHPADSRVALLESAPTDLPILAGISQSTGVEALALKRSVDLSVPISGEEAAGNRGIGVLILWNTRFVFEPIVLPHGIPFSAMPLNLRLGALAGPQRGTVQVELPVALVKNQPPISVSTLNVVSTMEFAWSVTDLQPIAVVTLQAEGGSEWTVPILAGRDTAEHAWDRPDIRGIVKHRRARRVEGRHTDWLRWPDPLPDSYFFHEYVSQIDLGRAAPIRRLRIQYVGPERVVLKIKHLSLTNRETGQALFILPIAPSAKNYRQTVQAKPFGLVHELEGALPRAWLARSIRTELTEEQIVKVIRDGHFPDGRPFDPRQTALIAAGEAPDPTLIEASPAHAPARGGEVRIIDYQTHTIELKTTSATPALLVLSEAYYPGWRARIDGQEAPVLRVDHALRGVVIPAGEHGVSFRYKPTWLVRGLWLTLVGLLGTSVLLFQRPGPHIAPTATLEVSRGRAG